MATGFPGAHKCAPYEIRAAIGDDQEGYNCEIK